MDIPIVHHSGKNVTREADEIAPGIAARLGGLMASAREVTRLRSHAEKTVYALAGLRIVSDFPLYGLQICHAETPVHGEVLIRCAPIPEGVASDTVMFRSGKLVGTYDGIHVLLHFPAGRFLVRDGKEILIDSPSYSDYGAVRAYLLGIAFGILCHQRGIMPLHASAIDVGDGCVAFVGNSGAGKSTLAAALARRGHEIITDDLCFLQLDENRDVQAWPGIGRIRLWEEAVYALGCDGPGVEREMHGFNKYFVPIRPPRNPSGSRPLRRVYQLHAAGDGAAQVTRLHGTAAVEALVQNVYHAGLAKQLGYMPYAFRVCAAAAPKIQVFRFSRTRDFDALSQGVEVLEHHLNNTVCC
jgi:hypothetical protein